MTEGADIGTVGILGAGDMGSGVASALTDAGFRVVTDLSGRSQETRELAARARMEDLGSLHEVLGASRVLLSILPPAAAVPFARRVATESAGVARPPLFADCNAVSPATARSIGELVAAAGLDYLDVGIVGRPPREGARLPTRFYVSGAKRGLLLTLDVPRILMIDLGELPGAASAIKMVYASLNKGVDALLTAVLLAAEGLGVRAELMAELERSQGPLLERMQRRLPYLAATAERFAPEMTEIAATYESVGVTRAFHEGAEWLYSRLAESDYASETRATLPESRSLDDAIDAFRRVIDDSDPQ
jgi:3-hydroxyisobutyrate dehydrogenase-like beta-hydroxyacid dehydrogenase